jgi:sugar/nucleoside kinase (ribokinase family)
VIVVIGDLVADIIVLGAAGLERGTDNPAQVKLTRGGSAANVAVAVAPRHPVRFVGRVGDDTIGRALVAELATAGVEPSVQWGGRTGAIVVLVDEAGERTMITDRGAAAELEAIEPSRLDGADWLHIPLYGFSSEHSSQVLTDAAAHALHRGTTVSIDLSSVATMREMGAQRVAAVLRAVTPHVVFANADEARLAVDLSLDLGEVVYIVKRGSDPVLVRAGGREQEVPVRRIHDITDSTGAGDAFAAGYIVAALEGDDPFAAAAAGSERAADALLRAGAL